MKRRGGHFRGHDDFLKIVARKLSASIFQGAPNRENARVRDFTLRNLLRDWKFKIRDEGKKREERKKGPCCLILNLGGVSFRVFVRNFTFFLLPLGARD